MIKRASWLLTLGMLATIMSVVVAPQCLMAAMAVTESWLPARLVPAVAFFAYDLGLWGTGLAVWLVGRRIGWARGRVMAVLVTASPIVAEAALAALLGETPAGFADATGLPLRFVIGMSAIGIAVQSTKWPARSGGPSRRAP